MMKHLRPVQLAALTLFIFSFSAQCDENVLTFKGAAYPLELGGAARAAAGQSPLSGIPAEVYDTVLLQGVMPDPGARLRIQTGAGAAAKLWKEPVIHRFSNGRFWAKFTAGVPTREPVRISVEGIEKDGGAVSIYEAETIAAAAELEPAAAGGGEGLLPAPAGSGVERLPFTLVARAQWKAQPPKGSYIKDTPVRFTMHHTAGAFPKSHAEAVTEVQFIQDYHKNAKGWIDIGYHFVISPQGGIFEGRPMNVVGAHVSGHNPGNTGISFMGNFMDQTPTKEALDAFVKVGQYLKNANGVAASGFKAHRDMASTACPGDILYGHMTGLRSEIFGKEAAEFYAYSVVSPEVPGISAADPVNAAGPLAELYRAAGAGSTGQYGFY
jgi:N-acetylmuramoyl-L-alanine amidase